MAHPFILLSGSFKEQMFILIFDEVRFLSLFLYNHAFEILPKQSLPNSRSQGFSMLFLVLGLRVLSVIYFALIFAYGMRYGSKFFFFCAYRYSVFPAPRIEMISFPDRIAAVLVENQLDMYGWFCRRSLFINIDTFANSVPSCHLDGRLFIVLKSDSECLPTLFFLKINLAVPLPLLFHRTFKISALISPK